MTRQPVCGAKTRGGGTCKNPPVTGGTRCTSWWRHAAPDLMERRLTCDNENGPARRANVRQGLTRSLDLGKEGLAMQPTRDTLKTGIAPAPNAPTGLTRELRAIFDSWPERFRSKVRLDIGCWEWLASKDKYGYGRYGRGDGRGTGMAHRYALELVGRAPAYGVSVDHLCMNPSCVRPDHLDEDAGQAENVRRGPTCNAASGLCRRGLHAWVPENILTEGNGTRRCKPCREATTMAGPKPPKTHCPHGHPYDEANTRIRPNGSRDCKACHRERERARYRARKRLD